MKDLNVNSIWFSFLSKFSEKFEKHFTKTRGSVKEPSINLQKSMQVVKGRLLVRFPNWPNLNFWYQISWRIWLEGFPF